MACILGTQPEFIGQETSLFLSRLFWITYRHEMNPIPNTTFTSDAGWGCMIRTGQMLAASAIAATLLGTNWCQQDMDPIMRRFILALFYDTPEAPLSLHNIVLEGVQNGRRVGEWHAPSVTARSITDIVNRSIGIGMASYCAVDMTVDLLMVNNLLMGRKLLVWIPMRLGLDYLNAVYFTPLKKLLSSEYSVGIAGGRPNSSLYFPGFDGDYLIYLDPHYSRPAVDVSGSELSDTDLATYSCADVKTIHMGSIDPCFVAGFIIPDTDALEIWKQQMLQVRTETGDAFISFKETPARRMTQNLEDDLISIEFE